MQKLAHVESVQCAAVSTHCSFINVPPQKMLANDGDEEYDNPTCHPISPFTAF